MSKRHKPPHKPLANPGPPPSPQGRPAGQPPRAPATAAPPRAPQAGGPPPAAPTARAATALRRTQVLAAESARLVAEVKATHASVSERFNSLANALPIMIRTNGLMQVVAFLEDKRERARLTASGDGAPLCAEGLIADHLAQMLRAAGVLRGVGGPLTVLRNAGPGTLMSVEEAAMEAAVFHKRFASASLGAPVDRRD